LDKDSVHAYYFDFQSEHQNFPDPTKSGSTTVLIGTLLVRRLCLCSALNFCVCGTGAFFTYNFFFSCRALKIVRKAYFFPPPLKVKIFPLPPSINIYTLGTHLFLRLFLCIYFCPFNGPCTLSSRLLKNVSTSVYHIFLQKFHQLIFCTPLSRWGGGGV
jgi:hypothetical protein